jgi:TonB family protein
MQVRRDAMLSWIFICATLALASAAYGAESITKPIAWGDHACTYPVRPAYQNFPPPTTLTFLVTAEGTTKDIAVKNSSGRPDYDAFAAHCAMVYRYKPATVNGKPVAYQWTVSFDWQNLGWAPESVEAWPGMRNIQEDVRDSLAQPSH